MRPTSWSYRIRQHVFPEMGRQQLADLVEGLRSRMTGIHEDVPVRAGSNELRLEFAKSGQQVVEAPVQLGGLLPQDLLGRVFEEARVQLIGDREHDQQNPKSVFFGHLLDAGELAVDGLP